MPNKSNPLFPSISPFDVRRIKVGDGHILYLEQYGNPDGVPAVFLHGGPGGGCQSEQARIFDPGRYRIILFDQRGSGRSEPKRELQNNTTRHLVADMHFIREHLEFEQWILVGGSWGSTLAISYAEAHPNHVLGIVLRAVFLGSRREISWAFEKAAQIFYPELWKQFVNVLPHSEQTNPISAYGARLSNTDPRVHVPAARIWSQFEHALSSLEPGNVTLPRTLFDDAATTDLTGPNTPYLEWHYINHDCFLAPNQLLHDAKNLTGIPGIIVQGRYDLLCPPTTAAELASLWPNCELRLIPASGHSANESAIRCALVAAVTDIYDKIQQF